MSREFAYGIVGLGGIGSAATFRLAAQAPGEVIAFEQFELGHGGGASEDHSRIIRRSYHTPGYVRLTDEAYRAWREVEEASGERLVVRTGGLDLAPQGAAIPLDDYADSMRAEGVPFEELDGEEVMRRWPQWRLPAGTSALFQEDGGVVAASRANEAHRRLAFEWGAVLRDRTPVTAIADEGDEVAIEAGGERYRIGTLVVAADAWTNAVLAMMRAPLLPLTVTKEQVVYFDARPEFAADRFPAWIWMDDPSFYGVAAFGNPGPKVGQDAGGPEIDPDAWTDEPDPGALERVRSFVRDHLPSAGGDVSVSTCLYTMPPDRDFVLDRVPGHPNVLVTLGAAHGFKFAAWFGKALADLAIGGTTAADITPFAFDRPILQELDPPRRFLV